MWLTSTLFYLGDLGKYSDDYFMAARDPLTGAPVVAASAWAFPFSRPLNWLVLNEVSRAFWFHDAAFHLVNATAHGVVVALLVTLLLALGGSAAAATGAAALFLAYPAHFEVVFWPTALPVALASGLFLVVCSLTVWRARCDADRHPSQSRCILLAIALLSFAIPCLYEQPAAGLAALPLLYCAAARDGARQRWRSGLTTALAACAGAGSYLVLYWETARRGARGTSSALPGLDILGSEASRLARDAAARIGLHEFGGGALTAGLESLRAAPGFAFGVAIVATASVALALRPGREHTPAAVARRDLVLAFGLAVFLLCWLPLLAARGTPVSSRLVYAPALGLAIALSVALDGLAYGRTDSSKRAAVVRRVVTAIVTIVGLLACVAMVGVQAGYRARTHADTALGAELVRALPSPPPGTLFLVLDDARRPVHTDAAAFDGEFMGALTLPQAATPWVRWAYGRRDLFAAQAAPWGATIAEVSDQGARIVGLEPAFPMQLDPDPRGGIVIPWSRLVALRVGLDGRVHVDTSLASARGLP